MTAKKFTESDVVKVIQDCTSPCGSSNSEWDEEESILLNLGVNTPQKRKVFCFMLENYETRVQLNSIHNVLHSKAVILFKNFRLDSTL